MNELRQKIIATLELKKVMPDVYMMPKPYITDSEINAILDAVIAALPEEKPVPAYKDAIKWSQGYREAILDTKATLQAAKDAK